MAQYLHRQSGAFSLNPDQVPELNAVVQQYLSTVYFSARHEACVGMRRGRPNRMRATSCSRCGIIVYMYSGTVVGKLALHDWEDGLGGYFN